MTDISKVKEIKLQDNLVKEFIKWKKSECGLVDIYLDKATGFVSLKTWFNNGETVSNPVGTDLISIGDEVENYSIYNEEVISGNMIMKIAMSHLKNMK